MRPIRILFNTWANRENVNSQSLTAREIACRLSPERYRSSFFLGWRQEADPRLTGRPNVRLLRVPPRLGSLTIARELLWGAHDIVFYPTLNDRASRLFWSFRRLARHRRLVDCVETSLDQLGSGAEAIARLQRFKRADFRSAITPAIVHSLLQEHDIEAQMIPLGVDLDIFRPVDRSHREPPWRVVYVATLQPRKQPHLILELAQRLRNRLLEFHLIGPVLGHPEYHRQLLEKKERQGLKNVFFHGALSQEEISRQLEKMDVYVLPSRLEGFGKTTLEAAASGLPAIVFSDYETTAVVDGLTGFQVTTLDEMEQALRRLLDDPDLRQEMGSAASEHARAFSWGPITRRWEAVFEELIRRSTGR